MDDGLTSADINENVSDVNDKISSLWNERQFREIQELLSIAALLDFSSKYQHCIQVHHPGSGAWFLRAAPFRTFLLRKRCTLLCLGMPGAEKSFISSIAIKYLKTVRTVGHLFVVAYLFCNYKSREQQNMEGMLSILLRQLIEQSPDRDSGTRLWRKCKRSGTRASADDLTASLAEVLGSFGATTRVCVVIDRLDECRRDGTVENMMKRLFSVQRDVGLRILVTSRPVNEVTNIFDEHSHLRLDIRAQEEDLESYVQSEVTRSSSLNWLPKEVGLWNSVKDSLIQTADGM